MGAKFGTANRVMAPPQAVMNRQVIAKRTPPPPPVQIANQQQALAAHPGQPLARSEVRSLRPTVTEAAHPMVKQGPSRQTGNSERGPSGQPSSKRASWRVQSRPAESSSLCPAESAECCSTGTTRLHAAHQPAGEPSGQSASSKRASWGGQSRPAESPECCSTGTARLHAAHQPPGEPSDQSASSKRASWRSQSRTAESSTLRPAESSGTATAEQSSRHESAEQPPGDESSAHSVNE
jgi:hypothetical protein